MTTRLASLLTSSSLLITLAACTQDPETLPDDDPGISLDETGETEDEPMEPEPDIPSDENQCQTDAFELASVTPNVMLVLDKSGSMNLNRWDDDDDDATPRVTRWHSLHGVVADVAGKYDDIMQFGVTLFPAIDARAQGGYENVCKVSDEPDVPIGPSNAAAILAAIPEADDLEFEGATPATDGILTGAAHLESLDDGAPAALVLITDGAANCASVDNYTSDYDENLEAAVRDAWDGPGIPTYVVGIDIGTDGGPVDVNPRVALDAVARAGGVARSGDVGFYDATDPEALGAALDEITHRLGCSIELDFAPQAYLDFWVEIAGERIPRLDSCAGDGVGWVQLDPIDRPNLIELCSASCDTAEIGGGTATMCPLVP